MRSLWSFVVVFCQCMILIPFFNFSILAYSVENLNLIYIHVYVYTCIFHTMSMSHRV